MYFQCIHFQMHLVGIFGWRLAIIEFISVLLDSTTWQTAPRMLGQGLGFFSLSSHDILGRPGYL